MIRGNTLYLFRRNRIGDLGFGAEFWLFLAVKYTKSIQSEMTVSPSVMLLLQRLSLFEVSEW